MAKKKCFAVYDSKISAYATPFFMDHTGQALRTWEEAANDPQSNISKYPADFTLFEIAEWDEETSNFQMLLAPHSLGTALMFKKSDSPLKAVK